VDAAGAARGSGGSLAPRRPWRGRRVVLGVCGGIAAYKVAQLARDLTQLGAQVDVALTESARSFVGPVTFEGLTGRPVVSDIIAPGHALDHIRLARAADVVCIAPATADFLARAAQGRADDLMTAILLATRAPVLICPAMNDAMWAHPQTRANVAHLTQTIGYRLVGPATGPLAFGEGQGPGRLEEVATIVEHVGRALETPGPLEGRRVVVTAGPTEEAVDPVRVLTNRSSGRMGFALASAAWRRGADVLLISGPTALPPPPGPELHRVSTAEQMARAVGSAVRNADVLIMAAAVADFRPAQPADDKIKKSARPDAILLEGAPDVLEVTRAQRAERLVVVGFALETSDGRANAKTKLEAKGMDLIVLNPASEPGAGFEVETNRVTLFDRSGHEDDLPLMPKTEVAEVILDRVQQIVQAR
jgi:phosphopantothenoylcysteine decarboxylase/phosphopantothenate--cysteine ligase